MGKCRSSECLLNSFNIIYFKGFTFGLVACGSLAATQIAHNRSHPPAMVTCCPPLAQSSKQPRQTEQYSDRPRIAPRNLGAFSIMFPLSVLNSLLIFGLAHEPPECESNMQWRQNGEES